MMNGCDPAIASGPSRRRAGRSRAASSSSKSGVSWPVHLPFVRVPPDELLALRPRLPVGIRRGAVVEEAPVRRPRPRPLERGVVLLPVRLAPRRLVLAVGEDAAVDPAPAAVEPSAFSSLYADERRAVSSQPLISASTASALGSSISPLRRVVPRQVLDRPVALELSSPSAARGSSCRGGSRTRARSGSPAFGSTALWCHWSEPLRVRERAVLLEVRRRPAGRRPRSRSPPVAARPTRSRGCRTRRPRVSISTRSRTTSQSSFASASRLRARRSPSRPRGSRRRRCSPSPSPRASAGPSSSASCRRRSAAGTRSRTRSPAVARVAPPRLQQRDDVRVRVAPPAARARSSARCTPRGRRSARCAASSGSRGGCCRASGCRSSPGSTRGRGAPRSRRPGRPDVPEQELDDRRGPDAAGRRPCAASSRPRSRTRRPLPAGVLRTASRRRTRNSSTRAAARRRRRAPACSGRSAASGSGRRSADAASVQSSLGRLAVLEAAAVAAVPGLLALVERRVKPPSRSPAAPCSVHALVLPGRRRRTCPSPGPSRRRGRRCPRCRRTPRRRSPARSCS